MPKQRTRKTVVKRIKVSSTGKMKRRHAQISHLRSKENSSARHRKRHLTSISKGDLKRIKKQLPGA